MYYMHVVDFICQADAFWWGQQSHLFNASPPLVEVMSITHSLQLPLSCVLGAFYTVFYQLNYPSNNS